MKQMMAKRVEMIVERVLMMKMQSVHLMDQMVPGVIQTLNSLVFMNIICRAQALLILSLVVMFCRLLIASKAW